MDIDRQRIFWFQSKIGGGKHAKVNAGLNVNSELVYVN